MIIIPDDVRALIQRLSERRQRAVYCRHWLEMTYVELGAVLGCSGSRAREITGEAYTVLARQPELSDYLDAYVESGIRNPRDWKYDVLADLPFTQE